MAQGRADRGTEHRTERDLLRPQAERARHRAGAGRDRDRTAAHDAARQPAQWRRERGAGEDPLPERGDLPRTLPLARNRFSGRQDDTAGDRALRDRTRPAVRAQRRTRQRTDHGRAEHLRPELGRGRHERRSRIDGGLRNRQGTEATAFASRIGEQAGSAQHVLRPVDFSREHQDRRLGRVGVGVLRCSCRRDDARRLECRDVCADPVERHAHDLGDRVTIRRLLHVLQRTPVTEPKPSHRREYAAARNAAGNNVGS